MKNTKEDIQAPNVILLPGLGASELLFHHQVQYFKNSWVPSWETPLEDESLEAYATRWSETLKDKIRPDSILVGMSFGGMVALELAKHINFKAVVIVSSCRNVNAMPSSFLIQEKMSRAFPKSTIQWFINTIGLKFFLSKENLSSEDQKVLTAMAQNVDLDFFTWATKASAQWSLTEDPASIKGKVIQIHGKNDWVIPINTKDCNEIIEDGKHLIQMTHSKRVNEFIETALLSL